MFLFFIHHGAYVDFDMIFCGFTGHVLELYEKLIDRGRGFFLLNSLLTVNDHQKSKDMHGLKKINFWKTNPFPTSISNIPYLYKFESICFRIQGNIGGIFYTRDTKNCVIH